MREVSVEGVRYLVLDWGDIDGHVDRLAAMLESSYTPTLIIGIQRGGATVAHLLTDRLGVHNLRTVGCAAYRQIGVRNRVRTYQPLPMKSLRGRDVLLADDVSDTGKSIKHIVETQILPRKPRSLRTATLHVKPKTIFVPDYYVERVDAWIVYPWERYETAYMLLEELRKSRSVEEVRDIVIRGLGLPAAVFERAARRFSKGRPGASETA